MKQQDDRHAEPEQDGSQGQGIHLIRNSSCFISYLPVIISSRESKSSRREYSMITRPRPFLSSIETLSPRARCRASFASRTLGSIGGACFSSALVFFSGFSNPCT